MISALLALALATSVEGDWLGTLDFGVQKLRIVFHINARPDGTFGATLDSPDQGARGIPVNGVTVKGEAVAIDLSGLKASFSGTLAGDEMKGTFRQAGLEVPLVLRRMKAGDLEASAPKRPQIPSKPYPYEEEEVAFDNKAADGVRLAGTLTTPRGAGPFPAVILVTGSGPQTRDEIVAGHPVFLVLADHLTRQGIAVLRYDDRGIGKSTGAFRSATTADFAGDAIAAVEFLKTRPKIDAKRIGVGGHSEGGVIAPMAASRRGDVAFLVLLAPTSVPGREVILAQKTAILKAGGATPDLSADKAVYDAIVSGKDEATVREAAKAMLAGLPEPAREQQLSAITGPWFRYFLSYDPAPALEKLKVPALVLFGERDLQVLPSQNEPPLRAAILKSGNKRVRIEVLPGLNHLFQTAKTGAPGEYGSIEETFSPKALALISGWIGEAAR